MSKNHYLGRYAMAATALVAAWSFCAESLPNGTSTNAEHLFRSGDGKAALWFGNVDDLRRMGAPTGVGGPWKYSPVVANTPSDPYLMLGYERKVLELSHDPEFRSGSNPAL
ncbi:MAG TPA: hypothetical protein P5186_22130 [Candidatus Paceibacterota bacterium]|nr:hypothetical protein [Verrucomicrobiota bacterium]HRY50758.1 hypothetical protein [Candidatus Paceibacterota bacterium]